MKYLPWLLIILLIGFAFFAYRPSGNNLNKPKDEVKKTFFPSGKIREETPYKNGQPHGLAKLYYESGAIHQESQYINGKANGVSKFFRQDGSLKFESNFKGGQQHGFDRLYDNKGNLVSNINYAFGKKDGKAVIYNNDGTVCNLVYKEDVEIEKVCDKKSENQIEANDSSQASN